MASEWYCEIAGREIGPLTPQQMKAMAAKGQILPSDCVRRGARGEWILARQVKGLLADDTSAPPAAPPAPPVVSPVPPVVQPAAPPVIRIKTDSSPTEGGAVLSRVKRRREEQVKMFAVLLGVILALVATAVYLSMADDGEQRGLKQLADQPKQSSEQAARKPAVKKPPVKTPEKLEELEGVISLDKPGQISRRSIADILGIEESPPQGPANDDAGAAPAAKDKKDTVAEPTPEPAPPPETPANPTTENPSLKLDWIDASSRAAVIGGYVRLRVVSAEVVPGPGGEPPRLIITIELGNAGARDVEFTGWSRGGVARDAKLYDDAGNPLAPKALGQAPLPGRGPPMTIASGRTGREELAFEPPSEDCEYLLLELPASAFGMEGVVRMKMPSEMIFYRPAPPPPEEKPREPKPGTPEGDFGISPDDEPFR